MTGLKSVPVSRLLLSLHLPGPGDLVCTTILARGGGKHRCTDCFTSIPVVVGECISEIKEEPITF
jgi:hypothetical protein